MVPLRPTPILPSRGPRPFSQASRSSSASRSRPARPCAWISAQYAGAPAPQPSGPSSWRSRRMPRSRSPHLQHAPMTAPTVMRRPLVVVGMGDAAANANTSSSRRRSPSCLIRCVNALPRYTRLSPRSSDRSRRPSPSPRFPPPPSPPLNPPNPPNPTPARSPSTAASSALAGDRALAFARMEDHPDFDSDEREARSSFVAVIVAANRSSSDRASRRSAPRANPKPVFASVSSSARSSIGRSQRRSRLVRRLRYRARPEPASLGFKAASTRPDPEAASDLAGRPAPFVPTRRFASRVPSPSSVSSSDEDSGDCVTTVGSLTDRVAT